MTTPLENIPANTDTSTTLGNIQTKLLDEKIQELEQPSERQSLPKDIVTVVMDGLSNQRSYELLENKFWLSYDQADCIITYLQQSLQSHKFSSPVRQGITTTRDLTDGEGKKTLTFEKIIHNEKQQSYSYNFTVYRNGEPFMLWITKRLGEERYYIGSYGYSPSLEQLPGALKQFADETCRNT